MSAIVPAPTAWTDAAAPPPSILMTISMPIDVLTAEITLHNTKRVKETIYMVLRPKVSENDDHHNGNIDMLSIYMATERLVIVGVVLSSTASWGSAANRLMSALGIAKEVKFIKKLRCLKKPSYVDSDRLHVVWGLLWRNKKVNLR
jgi:hypothetical protein